MGYKHIARSLGAIVVLLLLSGCRKEPKAYIDCKTDPAAGATCVVTHQQGKNPIGACWDVKITCANGTAIVGNGCQNVEPGGKASVNIPPQNFKPVSGTCDKWTGTVTVENAKVGETAVTVTTAMAAAPVAPPPDPHFTVPNTNVELKLPASWKGVKKGEWDYLTSPDQHVVLAFVMFDKPNESTKKLGEVASLLGVKNVKWGAVKSISIGPDSLAAQAADGTCKFGAGDGEISYATVNPGVPQQVLIVYAIDKGATKQDSDMAVAVLRSMRRKR